MLTNEPKNLDGSLEIEGKGKGAWHPYMRYLSESEFHEVITYEFGRYRWESVSEQMIRDERHFALLDKVDFDAVSRYYELLRIQQSKLKHAGYDLGPREFTLTYSPDWFDDNKAMFFMEQAITRLCNYYSTEIIQLRAVGERTKNGKAHVHCYYELKGGLKMTDKNLKRAYHKWNAKHHHHKVVRKASDFLGYIEKDLSTSWFVKIISPHESINNNAKSTSGRQGEEGETYDED